jgi:hypothetical protein
MLVKRMGRRIGRKENYLNGCEEDNMVEWVEDRERKGHVKEIHY